MEGGTGALSDPGGLRDSSHAPACNCYPEPGPVPDSLSDSNTHGNSHPDRDTYAAPTNHRSHAGT